MLFQPVLVEEDFFTVIVRHFNFEEYCVVSRNHHISRAYQSGESCASAPRSVTISLYVNNFIRNIWISTCEDIYEKNVTTCDSYSTVHAKMYASYMDQSHD